MDMILKIYQMNQLQKCFLLLAAYVYLISELNPESPQFYWKAATLCATKNIDIMLGKKKYLLLIVL